MSNLDEDTYVSAALTQYKKPTTVYINEKGEVVDKSIEESMEKKRPSRIARAWHRNSIVMSLVA